MLEDVKDNDAVVVLRFLTAKKGGNVFLYFVSSSSLFFFLISKSRTAHNIRCWRDSLRGAPGIAPVAWR
jgi:hypothetical protein